MFNVSILPLISSNSEMISFLELINSFISFVCFASNVDIFSVIQKVSDTLENYNQIVSQEDLNSSSIKSDILEIGQELEKNYRRLSLKYYQKMFDESQRQFSTLSEELKNLDKSYNEIKVASNKILSNSENVDEKFNQTNLKLEGLGATFLNMILTISITSTLVAVLENTKVEYGLFIILVSVWLMLSSILFIGMYFKGDSINFEKNKVPYIIYLVITFLTLSSFVVGLLFDISITLDNRCKYNVDCVDLIATQEND